MTTAPAAPAATSTPADPARPGHPTPRIIAGKTPADWAIHIVLGLVMTAALAVGTWSIYTLLTHQFRAPQTIAILGCGMFDIAALFFALLSQRYAVTTDSGLAPRAAMLAMISLSSWVNWRHGQMEHWGTVGSVILAAAPVIAELSFEMFHRYAHREALRRLGRVAQALPVLGMLTWFAHPLRSRRALDAHLRAALTEHEAIAERRTELAAERARYMVSVSAPATTLTQDRAQTLTPATVSAPMSVPLAERATLSERRPAPALTPTATLTNDAHPALTSTERPTERPTPAEPERAHPAPTTTERAQADAQSAPSLGERKALKERQDALALALYATLNGRPEWTEIRDALVSAGLESVSRPTAQRIRERVESAHPDLPRERPALTATN